MTLTSFSMSLHYKDSKNEPCVYSISWINRWNLTKLAQILHWDGEKKWFDFCDLDLIFKVALARCRGGGVSNKHCLMTLFHFPNLIRKIIPTNSFSKIIHYVTIKFRFRQALFKKRFESCIKFWHQVVEVDRILRKLCGVCDTDTC